MALLSLKTGLRAGEIFNLKWAHVDFARGFINIVDTKSGRNRAAYLTSEVKALLENLYGTGKVQDSFVFTARKWKHNKAITASTTDSEEIQVKAISAAFRKVIDEDTKFNENVKDPRQKVCFHTLRHTFASWLVENGTDLYTVKELMGHSTLAMTERYSHLGENTLQGAVKNLEAALKQKHIEAEKKKDEEKQKHIAGA
jgi:integrase